MGKINFYFENVSKLKIKKIEIALRLKNIFVSEFFKLGDINYIFCNDEYLLKINKDYLNHDYYTDIITFNLSEKEVLSGDLYISLDRIAENASKYKVSFYNELYRVMIHGILHLMGYNDKNREEKVRMKALENLYLDKFFINISNV
jgi:probable rRNA maturation factor